MQVHHQLKEWLKRKCKLNWQCNSLSYIVQNVQPRQDKIVRDKISPATMVTGVCIPPAIISAQRMCKRNINHGCTTQVVLVQERVKGANLYTNGLRFCICMCIQWYTYLYSCYSPYYIGSVCLLCPHLPLWMLHWKSPEPSLKHSTNDWLLSNVALLIVRRAGLANIVVSGEVTWCNKAATLD